MTRARSGVGVGRLLFTFQRNGQTKPHQLSSPLLGQAHQHLHLKARPGAPVAAARAFTASYSIAHSRSTEVAPSAVSGCRARRSFQQHSSDLNFSVLQLLRCAIVKMDSESVRRDSLCTQKVTPVSNSSCQVEPLRIAKSASTSPSKSPSMSRPLSEITPMGIRRNSPSVKQNTLVRSTHSVSSFKALTTLLSHRSRASLATRLPSSHHLKPTLHSHSGRTANPTLQDIPRPRKSRV